MGRNVLDLKLGLFRQQSSPFEVVEFDSERGKGMCGVSEMHREDFIRRVFSGYRYLDM